MSKYHGITYHPNQLVDCANNIHNFDEVFSPTTEREEQNNVPDHYLICDTCGLIVVIKEIITEEESIKRIDKAYGV
jgi:hypothetical protein